jgi:hypothetical protein
MDSFPAPVLRFVVDEDSRGILWRALRVHNRSTTLPLDVTRVGDEPDLPLGLEDPQVLLWAERENRIVVSADRRTMAAYLASHLKAGHHLPGLFIILPSAKTRAVVEFLVTAAYASTSEEWLDQIVFIK